MDLTNEQEVFDHIVGSLIKQGKGSFVIVDDEVHCRYRDGQGNKCAAGHIIPDHLYDVSFENMMAKAVLGGSQDFTDNAAILRLRSEMSLDKSSVVAVISNLQTHHDDACEMGPDEGQFLDIFLTYAKQCASVRELKWNFD